MDVRDPDAARRKLQRRRARGKIDEEEQENDDRRALWLPRLVERTNAAAALRERETARAREDQQKAHILRGVCEWNT